MSPMADHKLPRRYELGPQVLDRLGSPLSPGSLVQYIPAYPLIFTVADVRPNVDPRAPQGSAVLTLECRVPVPVPGRQPLPMLLVVGQLAAPGQGDRSTEQPSADLASTAPDCAVPGPIVPDSGVQDPMDQSTEVQGPGAQAPVPPGPRLVTPAPGT